MNKRQVERFEKLIRSTEEANAATFNMHLIAYEGAYKDTANSSYDDEYSQLLRKHPCGTPACVLGNFASRTDLQRAFVLKWNKQEAKEDGNASVSVLQRGDDSEIGLSDEVIQEYFGITEEECEMLFDFDGCRGAKTPAQAVKYLKTFLEAKIALDQARSAYRKLGREVNIYVD